jgi:N-acetylmuramoyl-L-alanine amidase
MDGRIAVTFCRSGGQASQDTDTTDLEQEAQSDTPAKGKSEKAGPQVDIGTSKAQASKVDGSSMARPPARLSGARPSASDAKKLPERDRNFTVAIDIGHSKAQGGALSARGVFEYQFNRRLGEELYNLLQPSGFPGPS